ncbi:hypothetical protein Tco_0317973 [Tanacetum coccineum]
MLQPTYSNEVDKANLRPYMLFYHPQTPYKADFRTMNHFSDDLYAGTRGEQMDGDMPYSNQDSGRGRLHNHGVNEARGAKDTLGYSFGESCIKDLESLHLGIFVMI